MVTTTIGTMITPGAMDEIDGEDEVHGKGIDKSVSVV